MRLFLTSLHPASAAQALDDARLRTAVTLTALQISKVIHKTPGLQHLARFILPVVSTSRATTAWASIPANFNWLCRYFHALTLEYAERFETPHPAAERLGYFYEAQTTLLYSTAEPTPFPATLPRLTIDFTALGVEEGHKYLLAYHWFVLDKVKPTWTRRGQPFWFVSVERRLVSTFHHLHPTLNFEPPKPNQERHSTGPTCPSTSPPSNVTLSLIAATSPILSTASSPRMIQMLGSTRKLPQRNFQIRG